MIIYDPASEWPPKALGHDLRCMQKWHAWYKGDPLTLQSVYAWGDTSRLGSVYGTPRRPHEYQRNDGSLWSGGVAGAFHRLWWGEPVSQSSSGRSKLHIPLAADIATASSDLLFGQELIQDFSLPDSDVNKLTDILDENNLPAVLSQAGELAAALGGVYVRVVTDESVSPYPIVDVVDPRAAIPVFRWGRLVSVQFWGVVAVIGGTVWRHIEEHGDGYIEHALFQGTDTILGNRVPLTDRPETEDLTVDSQSQIRTPGRSAFFIPNRRPVRVLRDTGLGESDYSGSESLLDAVDEAWSSLMRDVRLGKSRILIPQMFLGRTGAGESSIADIDQEVMVGLNIPPTDGTSSIEMTQFDIRSEQHMTVITAAIKQAVQSCGYSPVTFGMGDGSSASTATEVRALRERSLTTREKKTRWWTNSIEDLIDYIALLTGMGDAKTQIAFPEAVAPSQLELAQVAQALYAAKAGSTEQRVRVIHPDWEDKEVDDEVQKIEDDGSTEVDSPATVGNSYLPPTADNPADNLQKPGEPAPEAPTPEQTKKA